MIRGMFTRSLFYWLRAPRNSTDIRTEEWVIAIIRFILAACLLGAIIRPNSAYELKIYEIVSLFYLAYSLLIILVLRVRSHLGPFSRIGIHLADILWVTQLICLIQWPAMAFVFSLFVMASTAFRWGFWEASLTSATFLFLLIAGCYAFHPDLLRQWQSKNPGELLAEVLLYSGVTCMLGLLAEANAIRSEGLAIVRTISKVRIESGLDQAHRIACTEGRLLFGATQLMVVLHERIRNQALLHRVIRSRDAFESSELDISEQAHYLFPPLGTAVRLVIGRPGSQPRLRCHTLSAGKIREDKDCEPLQAFLVAHPFRLLLATALEFKDDWTVRVYVIDPNPYWGGTAGLRFLDRTVQQLAPVIYDMFLVGRLMTKAKAAAGSHMARELHDGVIQSLSSINLQIEQLRQQSGSLLASGKELAGIQQRIQKEIITLRDFSQQLCSMQIDSSRLLGFLAGMAVKFQCEHGIKTRFVADVDEVSLPPRICTELARITQEALANVRKHSKAGEALIRLGQRNGEWVLSVTDNGGGFGFSGSRSHEELQASGEGPLVIMERARAIAGKVCIESSEGSGSCLEITFPFKENL